MRERIDFVTYLKKEYYYGALDYKSICKLYNRYREECYNPEQPRIAIAKAMKWIREEQEKEKQTL